MMPTSPSIFPLSPLFRAESSEWSYICGSIMKPLSGPRRVDFYHQPELGVVVMTWLIISVGLKKYLSIEVGYTLHLHIRMKLREQETGIEEDDDSKNMLNGARFGLG
jgi:hypothetical protein